MSDDSEEDALCNKVMDAFKRQRSFQTQFLQQSDGGINPKTPFGMFEFDLQPYVDPRSTKMGVHERHFIPC